MALYKKLILFAASSCCIYLVSKISTYKDWLDQRIIPKYEMIGEASEHSAIEERKLFRYGNGYYISGLIRDRVKQSKDTAPLILLPPKGYVAEKKIDYPVPEPIVFYYFTGLKSIWANSPDAIKANWVVFLDSNNLQVVPVTDKAQLQQIINEFRKYEISL